MKLRTNLDFLLSLSPESWDYRLSPLCTICVVLRLEARTVYVKQAFYQLSYIPTLCDFKKYFFLKKKIKK